MILRISHGWVDETGIPESPLWVGASHPGTIDVTDLSATLWVHPCPEGLRSGCKYLRVWVRAQFLWNVRVRAWVDFMCGCGWGFPIKHAGQVWVQTYNLCRALIDRVIAELKHSIAFFLATFFNRIYNSVLRSQSSDTHIFQTALDQPESTVMRQSGDKPLSIRLLNCYGLIVDFYGLLYNSLDNLPHTC